MEARAAYSYPATAAWFVGGGVVTAVFSGSLAALTTRADLAEVPAVGTVVPSFTWVGHLAASAIGMPAGRRLYWGNLARTWMVGSVARLPALVASRVAVRGYTPATFMITSATDSAGFPVVSTVRSVTPGRVG